MCGICGKLAFDRDDSVGDRLIRTMLDTIRHRGPDDQGVYLSPQVGLGHARLSIIDLNTGHQPIATRTARSGLFSMEKFTTIRSCAPFF